jgi:preprotein translocase subunit SecA
MSIGSEQMRLIEKSIILQTMDMTWMNHLDEIDYLREGIGLRGYGQRDPLIEYKKEAYHMFSALMENIRGTIVNTVFRVSVLEPQAATTARKETLNFKGASEGIEQFSPEKEKNRSEEKQQNPILNKERAGRNDPCPCGSGKKFKKCCGK